MKLLSYFPNAIIHVDGDAFFTTCEEAVNPALKGKALATGKERGIVACASYPAKKRGVKRGMTVWEAKKICPEIIFLPSDYETYSLFSKRMFSIMKRFTPIVEEYSIDEGFADISGLRRMYRASYEMIAQKIKETIIKELGISVSLGLSLTKVLAKVASKYEKPDGFTVISGRRVEEILKITPLIKIWGFGPNTTSYLNKLGLQTAYDFAKQDISFADKYLGKIGREMWRELNGEAAYKLETADKETYVSISKTKTFTPATTDKNFVYAQILRNLESACIKARRHNLLASKIIIFLKTQEFDYSGLEAKLTHSSAHVLELTPIVKELFEKVYKSHVLYRATGVILAGLQSNNSIQDSLFSDKVEIKKIEKISKATDEINARFGKHTLHLASTLPVDQFSQHLGERGDVSERKKNVLKGETKRQHLGLPLLKIRFLR